MPQKSYKYSQQDFDNAVIMVANYNRHIDPLTANPRQVLLELIDMLVKDDKADFMSTMGFHVEKAGNYIRIYFSLHAMNAGGIDWVEV